jgi:hypothetical protein
MLALADHAHDDGTHCYPGIPYLAWKTGYSERNVTRILSELESDEVIESVDGKSGGYGLYSEYHIHIEHGEKKPEFHKKSKSKRVTTRTSAEPKRVTSGAEKGDNSTQNPDNSDKKGDNSPRANTEEPSLEPSLEPSVEGTASVDDLPDDATTRSLWLLLQVEGYPRNQAENALHLARCRTEFPNVDPVEVCKDFRAVIREDPLKKKSNARNRLRNFFRQAAKQQPDNVRQFKPPDNSARGSEPEKTREDYSWWFGEGEQGNG